MGSEKQMGMFRYGVINALLHGDDERSLKKRMLELSEKLWTLPDGRLRQFSWGTIEEWYYTYRRDGLAGLEQRRRKDKGNFRGLDERVCLHIEKYVREHPRLKTSVMIDAMRKSGLITEGGPSDSTIYRYVRQIRPFEHAPVKERRAFEAPYSGSLWQTDIMYGPHLPYKNDRGRWSRKQTFLVAVIDDHSRLLCHGEFYFRQDLLAYLSCLKTALAKRGVPERLYCDNGQVFLADQVKRIMARLGATVIHTRVRDCAAKGKIERFFLTVRNTFLDPLMELDAPKNLDELNRKFREWCEVSYNHKYHSGVDEAPIDRWMRSAHKARLLSVGAEDEIFYFETTRKVKKDGTFSLESKTYETSWTLAGKKVDIRYNPFCPERPFVSYENQDYGRAAPLNREFNSKLPGRKKKEDK